MKAMNWYTAFCCAFLSYFLPYLINPTYVRVKKIAINFVINYLNYAYFNSHKTG